MPWCPNCREEYRQGFKNCSDCDTELVDELPPLAENAETVVMNNCSCDTFLTTTADLIEAEVIESYLNEERIPVMKAGGGLGVNIYVPAELLEEAMRVVDSARKIIDEDGRQRAAAEEVGEYNRIYQEKRRSAPSGADLWCPKCRTEYRLGFRLCSECGVELVDKLGEIGKEDEIEKNNDPIESFCDAYLTTVANLSEAEMLEFNLNEGGIPVMYVTKGSGADLYVPDELLMEARDVIGSDQRIATDNERTGEEATGSKEPALLASGGSDHLWCPNCRVEYWQKGVTVCSDCGAKLVVPRRS